MSEGGPGQGLDASADLALAEEAADWVVRLTADDPGEREQARRGFEAWKARHPAHARAAAGMEGFIDLARGLAADRSHPDEGQGPGATAARAARGALSGLLADPGPPRQEPLRQEKARRSRSRQGAPASASGRHKRRAARLAMLAAACLGVWLATDTGRPLRLLADHRSAAGEQKAALLADGSRLLLAGGSAVNVRFVASLREISILDGEVLVDVAHDPARPFEVGTAEGRIVALGTRFLVRRSDGITEVTMLESRAAVSPLGAAGEVAPRPAAAGSTILEPGQRIRLATGGQQRLEAVDPAGAEEAFRRRRLVVNGQPLADVLDRIAAERPGVMRVDPAAVADIRVSAVLPLDDSDKALDLLVESFPQLRVRRLGPWLVLVDSRPVPTPSAKR